MMKTCIAALSALLAPLLAGVTAATAADGTVKIGVLNDMSGVYADFQGRGSVVAAQLAAEDFGGTVAGKKIEVVFADHENKPDIGAAITRRWFDLDGVDAVFDVPNSAVALAVADLARQRNKVFVGSGAGTSDLTGAKCSPNTVHWTYDTWSVGHSLGRAAVARGGKKWFFITADYAFGHDLESSTADAVTKSGGTVVGHALHPLGTADFSTYLLQAQASGADVLALTNAGGDTSNAIKQAAEFGLTKSMTVVGPVININQMQGLGLAATEGLLVVTPFYWDITDATRAFAKRYAEREPHHNMPNDMQAGVYAAVLHYLKAVAKVGSAGDGKAVVDQMKAMPSDDPLFGPGTVRPDGRALHPVYLMQVKAPAESRGGWDYLKLVATIPPDQAYRPMAEGHCPLVN